MIANDLPYQFKGINQWDASAFCITEHGFRFLESTKNFPDPYNAQCLLDPWKIRNMKNETVEEYIPEGVLALRACAYRGILVLVGVAAESIAEDLVASFKQHLPEIQASEFIKALNQRKNSAEWRWAQFRSRFPQKHDRCIRDELRRRFENVLESLLKFLKHTRDDAAHRRATQVRPEDAMTALASFVPFSIAAADIIQELHNSCKIDKSY